MENGGGEVLRMTSRYFLLFGLAACLVVSAAVAQEETRESRGNGSAIH